MLREINSLTCQVCTFGHKEDSLILCDHCDRGFHTECIGLNKVPTGSWYCKKCINNDAIQSSLQCPSLSPLFKVR